jgi:hypothetical protein
MRSNEAPFETEQILWQLFGVKMIAYRRDGDGQFVGTGFLNRILDKLGLFTMLVAQARLYKQYTDLAQWKGKRVANPFAPQVGSRPPDLPRESGKGDAHPIQ